MEKFANELLATLEQELQQAGIETENNLQQFERSYMIATAKLGELKDFIQGYTFKSEEEEIKFFKEIKPLFHKEAIYYNELYNIESERPLISDQSQKQFYEKTIDRIMSYFDRHRELYNYYRTGKTNKDKSFFQRSTLSNPISKHYVLDLDTSFSTPHSIDLAHLQAYEQLCRYIDTTYYKKGEPLSEDTKRNRGTIWSSTKAALIELAVALYYSGSVNYGKGGFKKFISELEAFFQIQLGNVYRVFLGMVIRKKEPAPFLHQLLDAFIRRLEEKSI